MTEKLLIWMQSINSNKQNNENRSTHGSYIFQASINPCPADPGFILFKSTVDPDQLASSQLIRNQSVFHSD